MARLMVKHVYAINLNYGLNCRFLKTPKSLKKHCPNPKAFMIWSGQKNCLEILYIYEQGNENYLSYIFFKQSCLLHRKTYDAV